MELISWLVLGIISIILLIIFLVFMTTSKSVTKIFQRHNNLNFKTSFTYEHVISGLGGFENILEVNDHQIKVVLIENVNKKYLSKMGVKCEISNTNVEISVKGFNIDLFYKKLTQELALRNK